jgi:hypothetical protein
MRLLDPLRSQWLRLVVISGTYLGVGVIWNTRLCQMLDRVNAGAGEGAKLTKHNWVRGPTDCMRGPTDCSAAPLIARGPTDCMRCILSGAGVESDVSCGRWHAVRRTVSCMDILARSGCCFTHSSSIRRRLVK